MKKPADPVALHRISDLPDGVDLGASLTEADARQLVGALAVHDGWVRVLWDRADAITALRKTSMLSTKPSPMPNGNAR